MSYHFTSSIEGPMERAVAATTEALQRHGFGVLTDIDVQATLKKKLDVAFRPYRILGACNPEMAYRALQAEDKVGTMLPCNVVLQAMADGHVQVSAVDPVASMRAIDNPALAETAAQVREKLRQVVAELAAAGTA
ncbi:DUF302 domain-containing protein [Roseomonas rosulenta]|uniref:DUF302 domain-containing protein n=1 Tax=Roseomonas rosulenta TaxID=2748667 RepID=UPI0018E0588A|nr:DUF302 domain-containing protein [Roseomonas rosulenta]